MPTSKPISTISYNTEPYLRKVLDNLVRDHKVQLYRYIFHYGERKADSEAIDEIYDSKGVCVGTAPRYPNEEDKYDKDHFHVFIYPNCKIDPMDIMSMLIEPQSDGSLPLGCISFRPSNEYDWLLYAIHDHDYLLAHDSESEDGKIPYRESDVYCNEPYTTEICFRRARVKQQTDQACIIKSLKKGVAPSELVTSGKNPIQVYTLSRIFGLDKNSDLLHRITILELCINSLCSVLDKQYGCNIVYSSKDITKALPVQVGTSDGEVLDILTVED